MDEPEEPSPDVALINHYLWLVFQNHRAPPSEAREAKLALLRLYRDQREEVRRGRTSAIDSRLLQYVREGLRRCIVHADPLAAVESFLEESNQRRGRPKTPHRDLLIAGDIEERVQAGATVDKACEELEKPTGLKVEHLRRIYFDQKRANGQPLATDLVRRRSEKESLQTVRIGLITLLKSRGAGSCAKDSINYF
jgi:hypothetical protein